MEVCLETCCISHSPVRNANIYFLKMHSWHFVEKLCLTSPSPSLPINAMLKVWYTELVISFRGINYPPAREVEKTTNNINGNIWLLF